ncbi:Disks large 1 [Sparganum proliferum]
MRRIPTTLRRYSGEQFGAALLRQRLVHRIQNYWQTPKKENQHPEKTARPEGMAYVTTVNDVHQYRDLEGRPYFTLRRHTLQSETHQSLTNVDSRSTCGTEPDGMRTDFEIPVLPPDAPDAEKVFSDSTCGTDISRDQGVVGVLALCPDWSPPFCVTLLPTNGKLGISILGKTSSGGVCGTVHQVLVAKVNASSANSQLREGDWILRVNKDDLYTTPYEEAVEKLKLASSPVRLVISRLKECDEVRDALRFCGFLGTF